MLNVFIFLAAYMVDLLVGDPPALPHPVVLIGKFISWGERILLNAAAAKWNQRVLGIFLTVTTIAGTYLATYLLIRVSYAINIWVGILINIWLLSTTLAVKGLADAAMTVYAHLVADKLSAARAAVGLIVGRDTDKLSTAGVTRATVETVAENLVDGVVAPLLYAAIGGAPMAMAYKAVNTLDSMIGYKSERYLHFGWFAARLDDAVNYLPARLVILLLLPALAVRRLPLAAALAVMRQDARHHPSPNGGIPESLVAGGLSIQLGGENHYFGRPSFRATMGQPLRQLTLTDIATTVSLMRLAAFFGVSVAAAVMILVEVI